MVDNGDKDIAKRLRLFLGHISMMIDNGILEGLLGEAEVSPRLRANRDMRTSSGDRSQRMLNALLPGT